jgi:putative ABC transport system permease protein
MSVLLRLVWPTLRRNPLRYAALILQFAFACAAATIALHFLLQEHALLTKVPSEWKLDGVFVVAAPPDREPPAGVASVQLVLGSWQNLGANGHSALGSSGGGLPRVAFVNATYAQAVAPRLSVGRWLSEADSAGDLPVSVVLNAAAAEYLGNGNALLGKTLGPNGDLRIVGVLAKNEPLPLRADRRLQEIMVASDAVFVVPSGTLDVVFPVGWQPEYDRDRAAMWIGPVSEAERSQMPPSVQQPHAMGDVLKESHAGYRSMWGVLQAVAGLILGLAAIGFTGVILSMLEQRWREYAVRMALGATPGILAAQLLTETVVTTLGGGVLGALFGTLLSPLMPGSLPGIQLLAPSTVVVASLIVGGLLSVAPLSGLLRLRPDEAMRSF